MRLSVVFIVLVACGSCLPASHARRGPAVALRLLLEAASAHAAAANATVASGDAAVSNATTAVLQQPVVARGHPAHAAAAPPPAAPTNGTSGMTLAGLQQELAQKEAQLKQAEARHSKATIAVAATLGSLLLLGLTGCAGMFVYRRFVASTHASRSSRGGGSRYYHYDADRLLDDSAALGT